MKIAVLMSTYNGEKYIDEQLNSLAAQTVADSMTVYIRDDGSSDRTEEIVNSWMPKLSVQWIRESNAGPAKSFWSLLMNEQIQADYYAFCDQDDIWDPDKLESAIRDLQGETHLSLCNCRLIDANGAILQKRMYESPPVISILRQFVCGAAQGCSMVFTDSLRRYFLAHPIECIPMHDTIVAAHALGFGRVVWDIEPRFSYRMHGQNVVAKTNKSLIKRVKTTIWNWKNSSKFSMSNVAAELLDKPLTLTDEERKFLRHAANYRKSIVSKGYLLLNAYTDTVPWQALRSYYLRVLLNLY